jgi:hypothetical protein
VGLHGLVGKKWLIPLLVILIIVLAIETAILVIIVSQSLFGGSQVFPGLSVFRYVSPRCQTLTWSAQSTTNSNRTILFTCPKGGALITSTWSPDTSSFSFEANPYTPRFAVVPTFTLPKSYLELWLAPTPGSCSDRGQMTRLRTGVEIGVGGYTDSYDYCAVIDNSVSTIDKFTIDWSNGTPPIIRPAPFRLEASPSTETVPSGGIANYTLTVTSLEGWSGNVSVGLLGGYTLGIAYQASPSNLILHPGGSGVATLKIPTCTPDGTYCAPVGHNLIIAQAYTDCLVRAPGGWCVDGYNDVDFNLDVSIS